MRVLACLQANRGPCSAEFCRRKANAEFEASCKLDGVGPGSASQCAAGSRRR